MIKLDDNWNIKFIGSVYCLRHTECEDGSEDIGCACDPRAFCQTCDAKAPKEVVKKYKFICRSE